jgi:hypothetical protein
MTTSMEDAAVQSIGNVCTRLREAIAAAIPVSPDQYMTVTVPGTVIDTTELSAGGSYVYDGSKAIVTPMAIQQAEAKLVDGMMPLANIMVRLISCKLSVLIASPLPDDKYANSLPACWIQTSWPVWSKSCTRGV